MNAIVVDTDVLSLLFKHDTRAELFRPFLTGTVPVISFMTVAELDRWTLERNWGEQRKNRLAEYLKNFVVHPVNRSLCHMWAEVSYEARKNGHPLQCADAWIAATARLHHIPLLTNNSSDYKGVSQISLLPNT